MIKWLFEWLFGDYVKRQREYMASQMVRATELNEPARSNRTAALREMTEASRPIDQCSREYAKSLASVWNNDAFQTELFVTKNMIVGKLIDGATDEAVKLQCMLKGIDLLVAKIQACYVNTINAEKKDAVLPPGFAEELSQGD